VRAQDVKTDTPGRLDWENVKTTIDGLRAWGIFSAKFSEVELSGPILTRLRKEGYHVNRMRNERAYDVRWDV